MELENLISYLNRELPEVEMQEQWGDVFFFYAPSGVASDVYFATIKTADDEYDSVSRLGEGESRYRLNIWLKRDRFTELFPGRTEEPDYETLDRLFPHPHYAGAKWAAIISPSEETFENLKPLLVEAYQLAVAKHASS